jgi:hypothetical protein
MSNPTVPYGTAVDAPVIETAPIEAAIHTVAIHV